jgi:hypothetical protein
MVAHTKLRRPMKMILTSATTPDEYVACLDGWQRRYVQALRETVLRTASPIDEHLKWGHLVYVANGPAILIRAEPARVLLGFWRGKRLLHLEPRLVGGGKYELRTLQLRENTPLAREAVVMLVRAAVKLNKRLGDPTAAVRAGQPSEPA